MEIKQILQKYLSNEKIFSQVQREISHCNMTLEDIANIKFPIYIDEEEKIKSCDLYSYFFQTKMVAQHLLNLFRNDLYFSGTSKDMIFKNVTGFDGSYTAVIRSKNPTAETVAKVVLEYVILFRILAVIKDDINDGHSPEGVHTKVHSSSKEVTTVRKTKQVYKKALEEPTVKSEPKCKYCDTLLSPNEEKCSVCETSVPLGVRKSFFASTSNVQEETIDNSVNERPNDKRESQWFSLQPHSSADMTEDYSMSIDASSVSAPARDSKGKAVSGDVNKRAQLVPIEPVMNRNNSPILPTSAVACIYCNTLNEASTAKCKICLGDLRASLVSGDTVEEPTQIKDRHSDNGIREPNKSKEEKELDKENSYYSNVSISDKRSPLQIEVGKSRGGNAITNVLSDSLSDNEATGSKNSSYRKSEEGRVPLDPKREIKCPTPGPGWSCTHCTFLNRDDSCQNCESCMEDRIPNKVKVVDKERDSKIHLFAHSYPQPMTNQHNPQIQRHSGTPNRNSLSSKTMDRDRIINGETSPPGLPFQTTYSNDERRISNSSDKRNTRDRDAEAGRSKGRHIQHNQVEESFEDGDSRTMGQATHPSGGRGNRPRNAELEKPKYNIKRHNQIEESLDPGNRISRPSSAHGNRDKDPELPKPNDQPIIFTKVPIEKTAMGVQLEVRPVNRAPPSSSPPIDTRISTESDDLERKKRALHDVSANNPKKPAPSRPQERSGRPNTAADSVDRKSANSPPRPPAVPVSRTPESARGHSGDRNTSKPQIDPDSHRQSTSRPNKGSAWSILSCFTSKVEEIGRCSQCQSTITRNSGRSLCERCLAKMCSGCRKRAPEEKYKTLCEKCYRKSCGDCGKGEPKPKYNNVCKKCHKKQLKSGKQR